MSKIKITADKIGGTLAKVGGQEVIIIPFDANYMDKFTRKDGTTGLTIQLAIWDLKEPKHNDNGFSDIGFVKPDYKSKVFKELTDEAKKAIPICGNVTEFESKVPEAKTVTLDTPEIPEPENKEGMPF